MGRGVSVGWNEDEWREALGRHASRVAGYEAAEARSAGLPPLMDDLAAAREHEFGKLEERK